MNSFFERKFAFIIAWRNMMRVIAVLANNGKVTQENSRLFTSIIWLARMDTTRGTTNDVLKKIHLLTFKGSFFISLINSFNSNSLMRNSFTLFISFVFRDYGAKVGGRCAKFLHRCEKYPFLNCNFMKFIYLWIGV